MSKVGACLAVLLALAVGAAPRALGADVTDIGYLDQQALATIPRYAAANRELMTYKANLDRQFAQQIRTARTASDQARIVQYFQNRFAERQRALFGPLLARAQVAVAQVAASKGLSVVLDKRIVIVGGQDITKDVIDLLSGVADPVPPVNTPPPSRVGWIDQTQIDALPKIKAAEDAFARFQADQERIAQDKMKGAKTDADRSKIMADYQNAIDAEQKKDLQPIIDHTRSVVADIAKKKNLILVVDRSNIIYGGTDITNDVKAALQ
jgi:Skp family chaperone for outer membrane proteins